MGEITRQQFAQRVLDVVRSRFPLVKIGPAREPFSMRMNGSVFPLENLYRMALLHPDTIDQQVQRWAVELLRAAEGSPDKDASFAELIDRILPIVIGADAKQVKHSPLMLEPLLPGLWVGYVVDGDRTIDRKSTRLNSSH